MNVPEPNNYWDGIVNGVGSGGAEFGDILDVLDFPIESVEGDGLGEEDLDPSKFENLGGPIPMDALTGLPPVCQGNIRNGAANMVLSYGASVTVESGRKQLPDRVEDNTVTTPPCGNLISPESSAFQSRSPISVLEGSATCVSAKTLSVIPDPPVRPRSKRARKSTINPWLYVSPMIYSAATEKSSSARDNREKKRKLSQLPYALEGTENFSQEQLDHPPMQRKEISLQRSKKCTHCESTKTPQWREGPLGPKTLCNACGVRYRSGRLFPEYRPAASPTFHPTLHSNSHKKVIAMRKKATQQAGIGEDPMSPLPELVPASSYHHLLDYIC